MEAAARRPTVSEGDSRRAAVRLLASHMLEGLAAAAGAHDDDMIEQLVFTGVWTANTAHLASTSSARYSDTYDVPPDCERRAVSDDELARRLKIPRPIIDHYVRRLLERGYCVRREDGLVAPSAVFDDPTMMTSLAQVYARTMQLTTRLRDAGFGLGDFAAA